MALTAERTDPDMASTYENAMDEWTKDLADADLSSFVPPVLQKEVAEILERGNGKSFGTLRARQKRATDGLCTIPYVAEQLGVSQSTVKSWIGHRSLPTGNPLLTFAIMDVLDCTRLELCVAIALALEESTQVLIKNRQRKIETGEIVSEIPRNVRFQPDEDIEEDE